MKTLQGYIKNLIQRFTVYSLFIGVVIVLFYFFAVYIFKIEKTKEEMSYWLQLNRQRLAEYVFLENTLGIRDLLEKKYSSGEIAPMISVYDLKGNSLFPGGLKLHPTPTTDLMIRNLLSAKAVGPLSIGNNNIVGYYSIEKHLDFTFDLSIMMTITAFVLLIQLILFLLGRKILSSLDANILEPIQDLKQSMIEEKKSESNKTSEILEMKDLVDEYNHLLGRIDEMTDQRIKESKLIALGELATQVVHDIRSPITALNVAITSIGSDANPKITKLIKNSTQQIENIANQLLSEYRSSKRSGVNTAQESIAQEIQLLVDEKKITLTDHNIYFSYDSVFDNILLSDNVNMTDLRRVLSNIINNSIESFDAEKRTINVSLFLRDNIVEITVKDDGKGISEKDLKNLFQKGVTLKSHGTGLGLYHADQTIKNWGGKIKIDSEISKGTVIQILLPISLFSERKTAT